MKKKLIMNVTLALAIVMTLAIVITVTFGWYVNMDYAGNVKFQITKIDSQIFLYKGIDSNTNGIPDLLSSFTTQELANIQTNSDEYPSTKRYYKENKTFAYIDKEWALSTEPIGNVKLTMDMDKVYPTQIKTFKFSVINNSDAKNFITFSFDEKTYTQENINLLSTMSVRIVKIVNNDPTNVNSENLSYETSSKTYFCDNISSLTCNSFDAVDSTNAYEINGALNVQYNNNCLDFWVQFEMESFETLSANANFSLSESDYQALQGKEIDLPKMKLSLEIRDDEL